MFQCLLIGFLEVRSGFLESRVWVRSVIACLVEVARFGVLEISLSVQRICFFDKSFIVLFSSSLLASSLVLFLLVLSLLSLFSFGLWFLALVWFPGIWLGPCLGESGSV